MSAAVRACSRRPAKSTSDSFRLPGPPPRRVLVAALRRPGTSPRLNADDIRTCHAAERAAPWRMGRSDEMSTSRHSAQSQARPGVLTRSNRRARSATRWSRLEGNGPSEQDHRAQHLAALHLLERRLDVAEADRLARRTRRGRAGPAGRGRSASGSRATAGSRRTRTTSARRRGRRRRSAAGRGASVGRGHADEHHGAGEVAGVEGLLVGLRTADRLDDDVGAEAAGERADRLDRGPPRAALTVCVAPSPRAHSSLRSSTSTAMIRAAPGQPRAGDRGVADAAAADHGDAVAAGRRRRC